MAVDNIGVHAYNDGMKKKMYCRLAVLMAEKDPSLSQRKLAQATGLNPNTIGRLRNNRFAAVETETIDALCDYFQCDIGDLFVMKEVEDE